MVSDLRGGDTLKLDKRLVALINSKAGSGGGVSEETVTTMITAAINSLIDSAPEEYDTLGKVAAKLLLTDEQIQTIMTQVADRYTKEEINDLLNNKVDKVSGKTLSSNDYTTAEKNKLAGIATGANKTIVDAALSSTSTNPVQNQAVNSKCVDIDNCIATNLINTSAISTTTAYGVTRTNNGDGSISFVGTNSLSTDYFLVLMATTTLQAGTYTFTHNGVANSGSVPTVYQLYKNGKYLKGIDVSKPITIDADGLYGIGAAIKTGAAIDCTYKPMLEKGVAAHNYVQYTGDTGTLNSDVANIVAKVNGTGWVDVDLSNTVFENNWCDITKSKLAYKRFGDIVSFHGYFYKLESASSLSSYSLMIKGLSKDDIVPKWMSNSNEIIDHKIIVNSSYEDISYRLCIHRDGYAEFIFKSTTDNNIDLNVGAAMIINSTYMT